MIARLGFVVLVLSVTGAVAHTAAQATWHGMGLYAAPPVAPAGIEMRPIETTPQEADLAPVHALAPFGRRVIPPPAPEVTVVPAVPTTPLGAGLSLRGVMVASLPARSVAIIALPGRAAERYGIGARVADQATLDEIRGDRVILADGERRETLWLNERVAPASDLPTAAIAAAPAAGTGSRASTATIPAPAGPSGKASIAAGKTVDDIIDLYRRRIAINPKAVLDRFGVSAVPQGYRVGSAPSEGVVRAGLRTGDIIAEVNGEAVGSIETDRRLFERVIAAGFARVKIIRGGQDIVLSFPFR